MSSNFARVRRRAGPQRRGFLWATLVGLTIAAVPTDGVRAQDAAAGTISVEFDKADVGQTPAAAIFANAVGEALTARGFTLIEGAGHAALVAEVRVSRADVGTTTTKVPVERAEVGPGSALRAVGANLSIALPTGKVRAVPLRQTRLEIRIARRGEASALWQGAAVTVRAAETPNGRDAAVAADLAGALLRGYPDQPADAISIP